MQYCCKALRYLFRKGTPLLLTKIHRDTVATCSIAHTLFSKGTWNYPRYIIKCYKQMWTCVLNNFQHKPLEIIDYRSIIIQFIYIHRPASTCELHTIVPFLTYIMLSHLELHPAKNEKLDAYIEIYRLSRWSSWPYLLLLRITS